MEADGEAHWQMCSTLAARSARILVAEMKLDFVNITIVNFKSFSGKHKLDLASFGSGLHFLRGKNKIEPRLGSNGAAKSSLWDALTWCLYGRTVDGLRNPDIEPWHGDKNTDVSVGVWTDKEHPSIVTRTTHPNGLKIDGETVGQEQVEQLIGLNFDTFCHTVLLGQDQPLFFDLAPKAKMDLFSAVLDLDRWDLRAAKASEKARERAITESEIIGEITGVETALSQISLMSEKVKKQSEEWNTEQVRQMETTEGRIAELKRGLEHLQGEHATADLAYDSADTELRDIQKRLPEFSRKSEGYLQKRADIKGRLDVVNLEIDRLKLALEKRGDGARCPTCGQSVKGTSLAKHRAELAEQLEGTESEKKSLNKKLKTIDELIDAHKKGIEIVRKAQGEFQTKANKAQDLLDSLIPQIAEHNARIASLTEQVKTKQETENPYQIQLTDLRRRKTKLTADQRDLTERLDRIRSLIERTKFWVKGFRDVRLYIIEDVLQELELTTNAMLEDVGLIGWEVRFDVEKETKSGTIQRGLNVMILSPKHKQPVRWESFSGGECQRLRLVGALALSEVLLARAGVAPTMEILDEPTHNLSDAGVADLVEFLADRAKQLKRQIWLTDHMAVESSRFASVLTVIKDKNGSRLHATS
jgi:DNA repair exonuclease SbcCD ATPase subunit